MANGAPLPANRSVHVYTDAPMLRMELNGKIVVPPTATPTFGNAVFSVLYKPGNLTAVALDNQGNVLAAHTKVTVGQAVSIRLSLDAPSPATGTGSAVVADGEDVAMVRAELLDAQGRLAVDAMNTIEFKVVSGDGILWATHSGNPASMEPPHGGNRTAYHGLARAIIRSSSDHASSPAHRRLMRQIDLDHGRRTTIADPDSVLRGPLDPIVVTATAKGMADATLSIPLTTDRSQLPLAVAARAEANDITSSF